MKTHRDHAIDIANALKENYLVYTAFNTIVDIIEQKLKKIEEDENGSL